MSNLETSRKSLSGRLTLPVVRLLARTPLTPNAITWLGFFITLGATALIVTGHFLAAGIVVIVAGSFDMLDGALARLSGQVTKFGGVLDSTLDRLSDAALLLGLVWVFADSGLTGMTLLAGLAMPGSLLVSYVRARAEAAGVECKVGLFTRPERVAVLALGLLLSRFDYALMAALALIALLSYFTVGQRLFFVWRQMK
jgi:CDP-diacylglycerol--glycerol-3-phosphate 3-phosphatidyltransferase